MEDFKIKSSLNNFNKKNERNNEEQLINRKAKIKIFVKSDSGWKFKCPSRLERASRRGVYAAEGKDRCSYFLPRRRAEGARRIFCTFQY